MPGASEPADAAAAQRRHRYRRHRASPSRIACGFAVWTVLLFWLWMLYVGQWSGWNLVFGACASALSAAFGTTLVARGVYNLRFRARWLRALARVPVQVLVDYWILGKELAVCISRGRRRRGGFIATERGFTGANAEAVTRRSWLMLVGTLSPNAYAIDFDAHSGVRLTHDLVPRASSEAPL